MDRNGESQWAALRLLIAILLVVAVNDLIQPAGLVQALMALLRIVSGAR